MPPGPEGGEAGTLGRSLGAAITSATGPGAFGPEEPEPVTLPWEEGIGEKGERKFTMEGKLEGEAEERKRIKEEITRDKRDAEYHRSRARLMMSYFAGQPEKLQDPVVKNLLTQRQFLAKQFQSEADQAQARLDKVEQQEKQQETLKELKQIETGGQTAAARVQAGARAAEIYVKEFVKLPGQIGEIIQRFGEGEISKGDYYHEIYNLLSFYIPAMAQKYGVSIEEMQQQVGDAVQASVSDPAPFSILYQMIQETIGG
jgi:hypothetical protein